MNASGIDMEPWLISTIIFVKNCQQNHPHANYNCIHCMNTCKTLFLLFLSFHCYAVAGIRLTNDKNLSNKILDNA